MRLTLLIAATVLLASGCATNASLTSAPELQVSCIDGHSAAQCLAQASAICGDRGYALFDREGNQVALAAARGNILTARCNAR